MKSVCSVCGAALAGHAACWACGCPTTGATLAVSSPSSLKSRKKTAAAKKSGKKKTAKKRTAKK